ncbi:MAG: DUF4363 family protein [Clostridia bacterium]|nr:DUF4363 family protein [Clostridia bacterium]
MKEIVILIVVLMLVFIPNVLFRKYLEMSGNELIQIVNEMKDNLEKDLEIDNEYAQKLKKDFIEKEKIWILIVDHDMLDEIEYEVENCVAQYSKEGIRDFIASANRLRDEIEDLPKREEVSLANIL